MFLVGLCPLGLFPCFCICLLVSCCIFCIMGLHISQLFNVFPGVFCTVCICAISFLLPCVFAHVPGSHGILISVAHAYSKPAIFASFTMYLLAYGFVKLCLCLPSSLWALFVLFVLACFLLWVGFVPAGFPTIYCACWLDLENLLLCPHSGLIRWRIYHHCRLVYQNFVLVGLTLDFYCPCGFDLRH